MIRPIKALAALGEEMGNRIGPQLSPLKAAAGVQPNFGLPEGFVGWFPRLRAPGPCGKDRPAA
jgi:hypothetical protein